MNNELIPILDQLIVLYQDNIAKVSKATDIDQALELLKYLDGTGRESNLFNRPSNRNYMQGGICYALQYMLDVEEEDRDRVSDLIMDTSQRYWRSVNFLCMPPCDIKEYTSISNTVYTVDDLINECLRPRLERLEYIKAKLIINL